MKALTVIFLTSMTINLFAKTISDSEQITSAALEADLKTYRVIIRNRPGVYHSSKRLYPCIRWSVINKKAVNFTFNSVDLTLQTCSPST